MEEQEISICCSWGALIKKEHPFDGVVSFLVDEMFPIAAVVSSSRQTINTYNKSWDFYFAFCQMKMIFDKWSRLKVVWLFSLRVVVQLHFIESYLPIADVRITSFKAVE